MIGNSHPTDIRTAELVHGRSINLALSVRGRKALARVGLEQKILDHAIPMRGRMLHDVNGQKRIVPYDPKNNQVWKILYLRSNQAIVIAIACNVLIVGNTTHL